MRWWCGARRVERWAARGGRLILTSERLVFCTSSFEDLFVSRWPDRPFRSVDASWTVAVDTIEDVQLTARHVSFRTVVAWNWRAGIWISQRDGEHCELIVRRREQTVAGLRDALGLEGPAMTRAVMHRDLQAFG